VKTCLASNCFLPPFFLSTLSLRRPTSLGTPSLLLFCRALRAVSLWTRRTLLRNSLPLPLLRSRFFPSQLRAPGGDTKGRAQWFPQNLFPHPLSDAVRIIFFPPHFLVLPRFSPPSSPTSSAPFGRGPPWVYSKRVRELLTWYRGIPHPPRSPSIETAPAVNRGCAVPQPISHSFLPSPRCRKEARSPPGFRRDSLTPLFHSSDFSSQRLFWELEKCFSVFLWQSRLPRAPG